MPATSLLSELRRRIRDVRYSQRALSFGVSDPNVTTALVEVAHGHFYLQSAGGAVSSLDLDLTSQRVETIGQLYNVLRGYSGFAVQIDEDASREMPSIDLESFGPIDAKAASVSMTTHLFSDMELEEILKNAIQRHNPSLTMATLPPQEWAFVLPLAEAGVMKIQAYDATKRKGLDATAEVLITLAKELEDQYARDTARLQRALMSPKEAESNNTGEGDVMLGKFYRQSLRTGFMSPISQALPPDAAVLLDPNEHDIEDDNIRLVWERNKNFDFYSYELWMDTRADVVRTNDGGIQFNNTPVAFLTDLDTRRDPAQRQTTSNLIFRSIGPNSNSSRSSYATFVEEFGQLIRSFAVPGLESGATYYFRLYVISINYTPVSSNIVKATTKPLRCRFLRPYPSKFNPSEPTGQYSDKLTVAPGATVNLFFNSFKGAFTTAHTLRVGDKVITPTIVNPYQVSFVVPAYQNYGIKDISVVSPTQLVDVMKQGITVNSQ